jgi:hypothetical protein
MDLVRDSALVLSNFDGTHRHPERFSRCFAGQVVLARKALGRHVHPGTGRQAADRFAVLLLAGRSEGREVSNGYHERPGGLR